MDKGCGTNLIDKASTAQICDTYITLYAPQFHYSHHTYYAFRMKGSDNAFHIKGKAGSYCLL